MNTALSNDTFALIASITPAERDRLVRLCAHLSGDPNAAEDLAQETLLEAWRHLNKLHDPEGYSRWLAAIARNVCKRWIQRQGRERARLISPYSQSETDSTSLEESVASDFDVEVELERDDLANLLDRAMSLLPPDTRKVLVERYVEESSQAEVAERLGMSEGAIEARLHRGKLALRRLLATDLSHEAASYGLVMPDASQWDTTRIWCPVCGMHKLAGRFGENNDLLEFRCPGCTPDPFYVMVHADVIGLLDGVRGYKPALTRLMVWAEKYFEDSLLSGAEECLDCGHRNPICVGRIEDAFEEIPAKLQKSWTLFARCENCGSVANQTLYGLAFCSTEGRRFLKEHPRIWALPEQEIEVNGDAAIVTSMQSVTDSARLDLIFARDSRRVLSIHTTA